MSFTEEERDSQDWVKYRAQCNVDGVFKELLRVMKKDIKAFGELPYDVRKGLGQYKCETTHGGATIAETDGNGEFLKNHKPFVRVQIYNDTTIQAYFHEGKNSELIFKIEPKWNSETLDCDLIVNNRQFTLSELSEMAIGDLLFSR